MNFNPTEKEIDFVNNALGDESQDFRVVGKVRYVMHKVQG